MSWQQKSGWKATVAGATVIAAVGLSMLNQWEMTPEAWGYWFFARVFAESGRFVVPDRSPLYVLLVQGWEKWCSLRELQNDGSA